MKGINPFSWDSDIANEGLLYLLLFQCYISVEVNVMEVHFQSTNLFTCESIVMNKNIFLCLLWLIIIQGEGSTTAEYFKLKHASKEILGTSI